jgi:hypothetical protein
MGHPADDAAVAFVRQVLHEQKRMSMPGQDCAHIGAITTVKQTKGRECDEQPVAAAQQGGSDTPQLESLVARVRGEYFEMPGLRLTLAQACRLWQVDVSTCEMLLDRFVRAGFLCKTDKGFYIAAAAARRRI